MKLYDITTKRKAKVGDLRKTIIHTAAVRVRESSDHLVYKNKINEVRHCSSIVVETKDGNILNDGFLQLFLSFDFFNLKNKNEGINLIYQKIVSVEEIKFPNIIKQKELFDVFSLIHETISKLEELKSIEEKKLTFLISKELSNFKELKTFSTFVIKNTRRNTNMKYKSSFTISKKVGIINEIDYFGYKKSSKKVLDKYYIIKDNEYGFNPYSINNGAISRNKTGFEGIVSNSYFSFKINEDTYYHEFFDLIIDSLYFRNEVNKKITGSTRKSLTFQDFLTIQVPWVNLEEQLLLINQVKTISKVIELISENIKKEKRKLISLRNKIDKERKTW